MDNKIKTISTLELRQHLGELTNQVIYSNVWLKVTKNRSNALLIMPWTKYSELQKTKAVKNNNSKKLINRLEKTRQKLSKKSLLINGLSWSKFIQQDRPSH